MSTQEDQETLARARLLHISQEQKSDTVLVGGMGFGRVALRALKVLGIDLTDVDQTVDEIKTRSLKQKTKP